LKALLNCFSERLGFDTKPAGRLLLRAGVLWWPSANEFVETTNKFTCTDFCGTSTNSFHQLRSRPKNASLENKKLVAESCCGDGA
jgi:hypothetical protein